MSIIRKTIHDDRTSNTRHWEYWYCLYEMTEENIRDVRFKDERILQAKQAYNHSTTKQVYFILSNTNIPLKNKAK